MVVMIGRAMPCSAVRCNEASIVHCPKRKYGWKQRKDGKINNSEEDNGNCVQVISANPFSSFLALSLRQIQH